MANSGNHVKPNGIPYHVRAYNAGKMSHVFSQYDHMKRQAPEYLSFWSTKQCFVISLSGCIKEFSNAKCGLVVYSSDLLYKKLILASLSATQENLGPHRPDHSTRLFSSCNCQKLSVIGHKKTNKVRNDGVKIALRFRLTVKIADYVSTRLGKWFCLSRSSLSCRWCGWK